MHALLEYLPLFVLAFLVLSTRASHERHVRLLTRPEQERLYAEFTRYRLMQYGAIFVILIPTLLVLRGNAEGQVAWVLLGTSAVLLVAYLTYGYSLLRARLVGIEMPEAFIKAYLNDRYLLGLLLGILIAQGVRKLLGF
jgi:hypothetical protein